VLFDREFFGKNIATLRVIAPFFVMPTVSALIWKNMMMHPVYGFIAVVMNKLGLPAIDWFSTHPLLSIIIIVSWEWLAFAFLILFTSIKSLDQEQKEAAAVDWANPVQFFFYVQVEQDSGGKLLPKMWQGSQPYSYEPSAPYKRIVMAGRFALGKGLPPAPEWIWSSMEYPRDGFILEWAKGLDSSLNILWDGLFSWQKT
jgi:hypothetical protein